ncbi:MAG: hypothetical protein Kow0090_22830 [Myxococcota bacterium]
MKNYLPLIEALSLIFTMLALSALGGCKMGKIPRGERKPPPGVHTDEDVFRVVSIEFSKFYIKLEPSVKFEQGGLKFKATGFDHNLQIGFIYIPPKVPGESILDMARRANTMGNLTPEREHLLKKLEKESRIYFLVIRGGTLDEIANTAFNYAQELTERGVLKIQKGSPVTTPEQEAAGDMLDFEKIKGREVDPGKIEDIPEY